MDRVRDPLLGRDHELEVLRRCRQRADAGDSQFVVVSGEAGIGKSRLLAEVADEARAAGWLVPTGRAAEFESTLPFGLVIDAFDPYLKTLDDRDIDRLSLDRLGALAAVFPALSRLGHAVEAEVTSGERFRVYRAVADLTERLAARQPVLLVLDDLQWADSASLELVAHLARRPPDAAVMTAVGVRTGAGTVDARRAIGSIEQLEGIVGLGLRPLPMDVVGRLVDVDGASLERLHHLSGGNPFYALQLERSWSASPRASDGREEVPHTVLRAIEAELDLLAVDARGVASAAAVVGDPFDLDLTIAASGQPEDDVLGLLDELHRRELVVPTALPRQFQFRHPLVRNAVYQSSPPGSRIAYHRRIAAHLTDRGATPVELAIHVEHSARHGDMAAVDLLERAGREVAAHAPASARRWFSTALTLLPATERPEHRIHVLGEMAKAHGALGDFAAGLEALQHSLAIVPSANRRARTVVTIACSEGERLLGRPELAAARLQHAYDGLDDHQSDDAVRLCAALSTNSLYLNDHEGMLGWAREAVRVSALVGDHTLMVAALTAETVGAAFTGRTGPAIELHDRVGPLLDALPDEALSNQLDMVCSLSAAELYLDLYESALAHAERGLELARRTAQSQLMPVLSPIAGTSAWMLGDMARSDAVLDDAVEAARLANSPPALAWHLSNRALGALMGGDLELAVLLSAEGAELGRSIEEGLITAYTGACRAQVLHETGQADEALALLLRWAGGEDLTAIGGGWRGVYAELLVRCRLSLHDLDGASIAAERARHHAEQSGLGIAVMAADRSEASVALECGDPARAAELAASAAAHAEALRSPVHVATCWALLGRALAAGGHPEEAVDRLSRAADGYEELGATRYRDQVEVHLRRLGRTVHRRSRPGRGDTGIGSLTGRELEVAELVYDRNTNREIAEHLFLSLKTVESHVRHIFHKLDVSSRVEVARTLADHRAHS